MASLGLRRLYVSSQNWLQPATRLSVNGTRHTTSQWRVLGSHAKAKYSTVDEYQDTLPPIPPAPEKLEYKSDALPPIPDALGIDGSRDWSTSYHGLSTSPFPKEIADVLLAPIDPMDVEMKPGKHFFKV